MFIPLIIAILLGFVTPSTNHCSNSNGGTVYVSPSSADAQTSDFTDFGDGDDNGEDGTGGETGNNPPRP